MMIGSAAGFTVGFAPLQYQHRMPSSSRATTAAAAQTSIRTNGRSTALSSTGLRIGAVGPTVMSATLTIMLAADLLVTGIGRLNHRSASALNAASLEEASLYRPSFPSTSPLNTKSDGSTTYAVPALFTPTDSRPIVLFDGSCNLCNWGVQLLLDYDSCSTDERGNMRVAALQSRVGRLLLDRMDDKTREKVLGAALASEPSKEGKGDEEQEQDEQYKSIVVCGPTQTWTNTAAILKMGRGMTSWPIPFRPIALLAWLIPSFLRNALYKGLSRNRKRLFGERGECRLWDDNWDQRFVDDALLGGEGSNASSDDPFADPNAPKKVETTEHIIQEVDIGDEVRIVSPDPVVVRHVKSFPEGLCVSGCTGTVVQKKPLVVQFDLAQIFGFEEESEGEVGSFRAYVGKSQVMKD